MNDSALRNLSKEFSKNIIEICKTMTNSKIASILTNQLIRSSTSVGANIYEAQYAQSKQDFISKLEIALKECFESEYWLDLMVDTDYLKDIDYQNLIEKCRALRTMLISSCKTAKGKN